MAAWGLTETSPLASVSQLRPEVAARPAAERLAYRARAGVPLPLCELRIMGDDGVGAWDGKAVGEIEIRGPWVTERYHKRPDAHDRFSDDGWFRTGDLGVMHPDGYIEIKDRAKDIIISGGENISSIEIEDALYKHPAVAEAAVVARPDEKWGETPCAFVALHPGAVVSEAEIISFCRDNLAHFKCPKTVVFTELPKTSTGKIQKFVLREQAKAL